MQKGRVLFGQLNCVACHSLGEGLPEAKPALAMKNLRKDRGCLQNPRAFRTTGFGFQRKAD